MPETSTEVTRLLRVWSDGDPRALDQLMPLVMDEVRDLARRALASESKTHTLQPTDLVDEVYLRLVDRRTYWWKDRRQFFACLAQLIRQILVDHARRHRAAKRGGGEALLALEEGLLPTAEPHPQMEALDDALKDLEAIDGRRYRIVMLRFFMGMTQDEIARELGLSVNTVGRQWQSARLWLQHEIEHRDLRT